MHKQLYDRSGCHVGIFDGEYFYSLRGDILFRADGDEIYDNAIPTKYVGVLEGDEIRDLTGTLLFKVCE